MRSTPSDPGPRPAWGCLDHREIQLAATGQPVEAGVREHLSTCDECRRAVRDLRRELGEDGGHRPLRAESSSRPSRKIWWLLLAAALVAGGALLVSRRPEPPAPVAAAEAAAEPAEPAAPPTRARIRPKPRPRATPSPERSAPASSSIDAQIGATIRRNQSGIRACYERALKRDDRLALRLDVTLRMRSSGEVEQVSIDGPASAAAVSTCLRNMIGSWRFPPANEAYVSKFPLLLQPGL